MKNYRFHVIASDLHGGHLISTHYTIKNAIKAAKKWKMTDCVCGCAYVKDTKEDEVIKMDVNYY